MSPAPNARPRWVESFAACATACVGIVAAFAIAAFGVGTPAPDMRPTAIAAKPALATPFHCDAALQQLAAATPITR